MVDAFIVSLELVRYNSWRTTEHSWSLFLKWHRYCNIPQISREEIAEYELSITAESALNQECQLLIWSVKSWTTNAPYVQQLRQVVFMCGAWLILNHSQESKRLFHHFIFWSPFTASKFSCSLTIISRYTSSKEMIKASTTSMGTLLLS